MKIQQPVYMPMLCDRRTDVRVMSARNTFLLL